MTWIAVNKTVVNRREIKKEKLLYICNTGANIIRAEKPRFMMKTTIDYHYYYNGGFQGVLIIIKNVDYFENKR